MFEELKMTIFGFLIVLISCFFLSNSKIVIDFQLERLIIPNRTDDSIITFTSRLVKINRTTVVMNGEIEALVDIDNNCQVGFDLYKMQGNEYRKTPYKIPMENACDWAKKDKFIYRNFVKYTNLPSPDSCPTMPKGKYYIKNFLVDASTIPPYFEGKYLLHEKWANKGKIVDNIFVYCELNRYT